MWAWPACCANSRSTCKSSADWPLSSTVDSVVELQLGHDPAGRFESTPVGGQHRRDGVSPPQEEGVLRGGGNAGRFVGVAGDSLIEPHAFDQGHVLDQAEERCVREDGFARASSSLRSSRQSCSEAR